MTAFRRLGGTSTDVSAAFTALATKFFEEEQSLVAYPSDPVNMVWSYGPHTGLVPGARPHLDLLAGHGDAVHPHRPRRGRHEPMALATFVAADLRRENQLGAGETDPFAADATYTPQFFATAAGSTIGRDVLAMAIDANDTALIRDAILAMGQTVGRQHVPVRPAGRRCSNVSAIPTVGSSTTRPSSWAAACPPSPSPATTSWFRCSRRRSAPVASRTRSSRRLTEEDRDRLPGC